MCVCARGNAWKCLESLLSNLSGSTVGNGGRARRGCVPWCQTLGPPVPGGRVEPERRRLPWSCIPRSEDHGRVLEPLRRHPVRVDRALLRPGLRHHPVEVLEHRLHQPVAGRQLFLWRLDQLRRDRLPSPVTPFHFFSSFPFQ